MSMEKAAAFAAQAIQDENLGRLVQSVIAGKSGTEAAEAVSALGKSEGYDFSAAEAASISQDIRAYAEKLGSGPLKEDELGAVAGGVSVPFGLGGIFSSFESFFNGVATKVTGVGQQVTVPVVSTGSSVVSTVVSGAQSAKDTVEKIFSGW